MMYKPCPNGLQFLWQFVSPVSICGAILPKSAIHQEKCFVIHNNLVRSFLSEPAKIVNNFIGQCLESFTCIFRQCYT